MTFPITVNVTADPSATAAAEGVTGYNAYLNGAKVGSAATPAFSVPIAAAGSYKFGVTAVATVLGSTEESAPIEATVSIKSPSSPINLKLAKA